MNEFTIKLTDLIAKFELNKVISELKKLFTSSNPSFETDIVLIEANKRQLEEQHNRGTIPGEEYRRELNKILARLLFLIDEIKKNIEQYLPYIADNQIKDIETDKDIILFFGANPGKFNVDVRKELEQISNRLKSIKKRDLFEFKIKLDVKPGDFQRSILELEKEPRFFHFGGNALLNDPLYGSGIVLAGDSPDEVRVINGDILVSIFSRFEKVECIFLNACNTMNESIELSKHIPYVISMNQYTTDSFAIDFASYFYEAIGAGKDVKYAFHYSIDELKIQGKYKKEQIETPQLLIKGNSYEFVPYNETIEEWADRVKPI